jgi:hypothetical protein
MKCGTLGCDTSYYEPADAGGAPVMQQSCVSPCCTHTNNG